MKQTLDYATPEKKPYAPLWPTLLVALVGCPVASIVAAVLAVQPHPPPSLQGPVLWGAISGGLGGFVVAALAFGFRSRAMAICIIGLSLVAAISGGFMLILAKFVSC